MESRGNIRRGGRVREVRINSLRGPGPMMLEVGERGIMRV